MTLIPLKKNNFKNYIKANNSNIHKIKNINEIALLTALGIILKVLPAYLPPPFGYINFAMLTIIIIACRRGMLIGFITANIQSTLVMLMATQSVINPLQFLLDYTFSYSGWILGVLIKPITKKNNIYMVNLFLFLCPIFGLIVPFISHWISGVLFYGAGRTGAGLYIFSFIYNGTYLFPSVALCIFVLFAGRRHFLKFMKIDYHDITFKQKNKVTTLK